MKIDVFKKGTSSYVFEQKDLTEVLDIIKNGDSNLDTIAELRALGKASPFFEELKVGKLPSFRFNFNFKTKASNATIIGATGLIYIDVDRMTDVLDSHNLIHASWKSVSTTGYGILVRIDGLTFENYADNYNAVSAALGLKTDDGARKATQQTLLSYDPEMYYNADSTVFAAVQKKVSSTDIQGEERRLITLDDTFLENEQLRFSNISDYFVEDARDFITFDKKEKICMPYIPRRIPSGKRNQTMFYVLSQYALLNPKSGAGLLTSIAEVINQRFVEKYPEKKIKSIVGAVITKRENQTITPWKNKERKIIFNPASQLTKQEKQKIVGQELGKVKTPRTLELMNAAIDDWNHETDGKITQKMVAEKIGMSIATVKRNWNAFKLFTKDLNTVNVAEAVQEEIKEKAVIEIIDTLDVIIAKVRSGSFQSASLQKFILENYKI